MDKEFFLRCQSSYKSETYIICMTYFACNPKFKLNMTKIS